MTTALPAPRRPGITTARSILGIMALGILIAAIALVRARSTRQPELLSQSLAQVEADTPIASRFTPGEFVLTVTIRNTGPAGDIAINATLTAGPDTWDTRATEPFRADETRTIEISLGPIEPAGPITASVDLQAVR